MIKFRIFRNLEGEEVQSVGVGKNMKIIGFSYFLGGFTQEGCHLDPKCVNWGGGGL